MSERPHAGLSSKWRDIQVHLFDDASRVQNCRADRDRCGTEERNLIALVEEARDHRGRAQVGHINRSVNLALKPMQDLSRFGVIDHWSAPLDTLRAGGGDCEDYALVKYLALRAAGIPDVNLKLLVVRHPASHEDHAVLAALIDGEWLILDNRSFALVRLEHSPYRVLAQLSAEPPALASIDALDEKPLM